MLLNHLPKILRIPINQLPKIKLNMLTTSQKQSTSNCKTIQIQKNNSNSSKSNKNESDDQYEEEHILFRSSRYLMINLLILWTIKSNVHMSVTAHQNGHVDDSSQGGASDIKDDDKNVVFVIPDDIKRKANKHRMILVMDLDQTMVFTRRKKMPKHGNFVTLQINDNIIYVEFRPHIAEFLQAVSQLFTIYVYTAGTQPYADAVLDSIPNSKVIQKRFYRESCIFHQGRLIKDLKVIHRTFPQQKNQQKLAILVDDNGLSISYNHPHSVRIRAFEGNQKDHYLQDIFNKLIQYYRQYCKDVCQSTNSNSNCNSNCNSNSNSNSNSNCK